MNKHVLRLANQIADLQPDADEKTRASIAYGLSVIWNDLIKVPLVFLLGSIAFSAGDMLVSFLFWWPLRIWLGGLHSKSWLGCLITTCCCFFAIHGAVEHIPVEPILLVVFVGMGGLAVLLFAPVDHLNKPILSEGKRKRMKWIGLTVYGAEALLAGLIPLEAGRIGFWTLLILVGLMLAGRMQQRRSMPKRRNE